MAIKKQAASLAHPVAASRWGQIKEAERVSYGTAQPIRTNWQGGEPYTCPELRHRSDINRPPSIVLGKRLSRDAGR